MAFTVSAMSFLAKKRWLEGCQFLTNYGKENHREINVNALYWARKNHHVAVKSFFLTELKKQRNLRSITGALCFFAPYTSNTANFLKDSPVVSPERSFR